MQKVVEYAMISLELQVFSKCAYHGLGPSYYLLRCDCGLEQKHFSVDEAVNALSAHIHSCRRALKPRSSATIKLSTLDKAK